MRISNSIWLIFGMLSLLPVCSCLFPVLYTEQYCEKTSRALENEYTLLCVNSLGLSFPTSLGLSFPISKMSQLTRSWFLTTGRHWNHLKSFNKIVFLNPISGFGFTMSGIEQKLSRWLLSIPVVENYWTRSLRWF